MIDLLLAQYASTLKGLNELLADVDDARLCEQPLGIRNHPAWTLAHLSVGSAFILQLLDETPDLYSLTLADMKRFGPGSQPDSSRDAYPSKRELLDRLSTLHEHAERAVRAKHTTYFGRPSPENLRAFAATIGNIVVYLLAAHESYHMGQIATWRRAAELPAV